MAATLIKNQDMKTDTYKQVLFLYTNNKHTEKEIKKLIPFKVTSKNENKTNKETTNVR